MVVGVGHINVAGLVDSHRRGCVEDGRGARAVPVPVDARAARQGGHHAGRRDLADQAVARVGHDQVAGRVDREVPGRIEARSSAGAVARARGQRTGERGHDAGGADLADHVVVGVGHIGIARRIHRHAARCMEHRVHAAAVGITVVGVAARQRGDTIARDLADLVVVRVGHIHRQAARIDGETVGHREAGLAERAVHIAAIELAGQRVDVGRGAPAGGRHADVGCAHRALGGGAQRAGHLVADRLALDLHLVGRARGERVGKRKLRGVGRDRDQLAAVAEQQAIEREPAERAAQRVARRCRRRRDGRRGRWAAPAPAAGHEHEAEAARQQPWPMAQQTRRR